MTFFFKCAERSTDSEEKQSVSDIMHWWTWYVLSNNDLVGKDVKKVNGEFPDYMLKYANRLNQE